MDRYYSKKLSAERLRLCYEFAPERVKRYLYSEIEFVSKRIKPSDRVLELGCGYGRVLLKLADKNIMSFGIDISLKSLIYGKNNYKKISSSNLAVMDASNLGFRDQSFDAVICIQNGLSAFHVDKRDVIREAIRVTKSGGRVFFSSYSKKFWKDRLEWFKIQSSHGLIGEIDYEKTGDGEIICKDGFRATTIDPDDFLKLIQDLNTDIEINEVDESSIFYIIRVLQ